MTRTILFQRQSYLQRKKVEVERSLTAIIKGKQIEEGGDQVDSTDQDRIISLEIDKIQSVSSGNYVNALTGTRRHHRTTLR